MKIRSFKAWIIFAAVLLVAALAVALVRLALADIGGVKGRTYDVTFTNWFATAPHMAGVGGGAIGTATVTGEIVHQCADATTPCVEAIYHFTGSTHSFDADFSAQHNNATGVGTIGGTIMGGWLKGGWLTGEYKVLTQCSIDTPGNSQGTLCFQGVLHLHPGTAP